MYSMVHGTSILSFVEKTEFVEADYAIVAWGTFHIQQEIKGTSGRTGSNKNYAFGVFASNYKYRQPQVLAYGNIVLSLLSNVESWHVYV